MPPPIISTWEHSMNHSSDNTPPDSRTAEERAERHAYGDGPNTGLGYVEERSYLAGFRARDGEVEELKEYTPLPALEKIEALKAELAAMKSQRDVTKEANEGWAKQCTELKAELADLRKRGEELLAEVKASRSCIQAMRKQCLCSRFTTKGFDYGEEHKHLGKPKQGSRWLTPTDLADVYLMNTKEVTAALADSQKGKE